MSLTAQQSLLAFISAVVRDKLQLMSADFQAAATSHVWKPSDSHLPLPPDEEAAAAAAAAATSWPFLPAFKGALTMTQHRTRHAVPQNI